jgi:signal peptidase II
MSMHDSLFDAPLRPRAAALPLRYAFLLAVAAAVIFTDQVVKAVVTARLEYAAPVDLLGGLVRLDYTRNSGAAFGFYQGGGALLAVVAIGVSAVIVFAYRRLARSPWVVRAALGLILGGAVGNLIDRVRLGYVVDFIDLRWWPVFNVADSAIVIGVALLVVHSALTPASDRLR